MSTPINDAPNSPNVGNPLEEALWDDYGDHWEAAGGKLLLAAYHYDGSLGRESALLEEALQLYLLAREYEPLLGAAARRVVNKPDPERDTPWYVAKTAALAAALFNGEAQYQGGELFTESRQWLRVASRMVRQHWPDRLGRPDESQEPNG